MNIFFIIMTIVFFIVAILTTIWLKFPQFKMFKIIKNNYNKDAKQTLFMTLAAHVGTGNLIGIITGIILGGPGILFWMWIYTFFASCFSLLENTYGIYYQDKTENENIGGSFNYIKKGLNKPLLAYIFAFFLFLSNGIFFPPLQINTIILSINYGFNINKIIIAIFLIIFFWFFIFRNTKTILKITDFITPIMGISYIILISLFIIFNYKLIPNTIYIIIKSAFNFKSFTISTLLYSMSIGIRRSIFSNEAGLGTTPTFSSISNNPPYIQANFQMLGVFIDTLIVCTLTGFFIIINGYDYNINEGIVGFIKIFSNVFGNFGIYLAIFFLFTFAISSLIGEYYMAKTNLQISIKSNVFLFFFKLIFSTIIFLGIYYNTSKILPLIDYGLIMIGLINIFTIIILELKHKILKKKSI